jgi:hypothetical protein
MPDFISLILYPREKKSFFPPERLHQFFQQQVTRGYFLAGQHQDTLRNDWLQFCLTASELPSNENTQSGFPNPFLPGVSPELLQDVDRYLQGNLTELSIALYSTASEGHLKGLEFSVDFYPEDELITVSMEDIHFHNQPYISLLALLENLYTHWPLLFGYEADGVRPQTSLEDAKALQIAWLYNINLWGPEIVEYLGREQVLNSPTWLRKAFDDGGIMLVPQLYYQGGSTNDYTFTGSEVARHLGLHWDSPS